MVSIGLKLFKTSLVVMVFTTAIEVVLTSHQSRSLFAQLQQIEIEYDYLRAESGKLKIELHTLSTPERIEHKARKMLGMHSLKQ